MRKRNFFRKKKFDDAYLARPFETVEDPKRNLPTPDSGTTKSNLCKEQDLHLFKGS